ncbi:MAG: 50S ribosomal protein L22 [bacterium]
MKAILSNYRQSPRKVALVAGLIRGKTVAQARVALKFANKRASLPIGKLLESAVANAKNVGVTNLESLKIQEIQVNKGRVLKRSMPRARGSASRINKRSSHVSIILSEGGVAPVATKAVAKASKDEKTKTAVKAVSKTTPKVEVVKESKKDNK